MRHTDPITVDEVGSATARRTFNVLAPLLGVMVSLLVVTLGTYVVGPESGTTALGLVIVVAVLLGAGVSWSVIRKERAYRQSPSTTTFDAEGVTRFLDGVRRSVPWRQVVSVALRPGDAISGEVVVIVTDPPLALVADTPMARKRARLDEHRHGGPVVLSAPALTVSPEELAERVRAWSAGTCRVDLDRSSG